MSGESDVVPDGGLIQAKIATELLLLSAKKLAASKLLRAELDPESLRHHNIDRQEEEDDDEQEDSNNNNNSSRNNGRREIDLNVSNGLFRCDRCDVFETRSKSALMAHVCKGIASPIQSTANSNITTTATTPTNSNSNNNNNPATTNNNLIGMVAGLLKKEAVLGEAGMAMDAESTATADGQTMMMNQEANNNNSNVINNNTGSAPSQNHHRKLFECDVCNMKFSNGANMRRHKMRHTGVKPYECRICQKRFFRKDHLAEHFTTHTKTLPYHCPICNRGFQRQIAMRAHFQNEHVGQHDLVKTCPLCSYRAGTMKSLRVHFFNRHGIDLDNPGPGAPSSLLLALDSPNASQLLPQLVAAAAQAQATSAYSDSGDSLRSTDNGTPPMHFLTPHVEISMADNNNSESFQEDYSMQSESTNHSISERHLSQSISGSGQANSNMDGHTNGGSPAQSPQSADSNSNAPTSSLAMLPATAAALVQSTRHSLLAASDSNASITPSISLIPIKQEPSAAEEYLDTNNNSNAVNKMMTRLMNATANSLNSVNSNNNNNGGSGEACPMTTAAGSTVNESAAASSSSAVAAASSSSLTSLIKVSPLKSLLREDLKRRINARASSRASRNSNNNSGGGGGGGNNNNNGNSRASPSPTSGMSGSGGGGCNSTNNGSSDSPSLVATTSNGVITSTGPESDLIALNRKRNLQCLFCGIEFPDQTLYFLHKGCHSESNPWKCNICGEQLNNVYEFNSHLLSKSHQ